MNHIIFMQQVVLSQVNINVQFFFAESLNHGVDRELIHFKIQL